MLQGSVATSKPIHRTMSWSDGDSVNGAMAPPAEKRHRANSSGKKQDLFSGETRAIVWGLQARAVQVRTITTTTSSTSRVPPPPPMGCPINPFAPKLKKCILPNFKKQLYERRSENLYSIITFHLSKLCKVKFSILRECHIISCEVAGEFWHWSLSGVKGLTSLSPFSPQLSPPTPPLLTVLPPQPVHPLPVATIN